MAGWHHRCNGHKLGQTLGDGEGRGGLVCCSPRGCKELDTIGQLNNNKKDKDCWVGASRMHYLHKVVRKGFIEKVTVDRRLGGGKEVTLLMCKVPNM